VWPTLKAEGVALFAISYDPMAILRAFADKHGITYPLLSDEGSHVIRRLGLVNERVQEDHAHYGIPANPRHVGLPYPGAFVLDEAGIISRKRFHESYRVRDTGPGLLARTLDQLEPVADHAVTRQDEAVRARAWLDSPTYAFFQRLHVNVEVRVAPGFHVYGPPVPTGFVPLSMEVAPIDGVEIGAAEWPAPHPFEVKGLDERFWVHEGTVHGTLPLTFSAPPGAGDRVIQVTVTYQACSDSECLAPMALALRLPVREAALEGRELPGRERPR
jgi:hypothetical protein